MIMIVGLLGTNLVYLRGIKDSSVVIYKIT